MYLTPLVTLLLPVATLILLSASGGVAHAQTAQDKAEAAARGFLTKIEEAVVFPLITLLLGVAFLVFLFGVFEYIKGATSESERAKGQKHILFGIIGMLIMLSAVAILNLARGTFGI